MRKSGVFYAILGALLALVILAVGALFLVVRGDGSVEKSGEKKRKKEVASETVTEDSAALGEYLARPMLIDLKAAEQLDETYDAYVEPYEVASDLSNVANIDRIWYSDEVKNRLADKGFAVLQSGEEEFHSLYEINRYNMTPSFITVDSLMHSYHLYFAAMLKNAEREYLSKRLLTLSQNMLQASMEQYDELKGTEWEDAAKINVGFFSVGAKLLDSGVSVPSYVENEVDSDFSSIEAAGSIDYSAITGIREDFTQYKPRGYYEGEEVMENYFRAMMWYGRMAFTLEDETLTRSAVLMTMALEDNYDDWEAIYAVTSFFAGASDDLGYCEFMPVIKESYGDKVKLDKIAGNDKAWESLAGKLKDMPAPQICSIPVYEDEENIVTSYRFMGQRFTIDANIMQNLVYRSVLEDSNGNTRMLPDVLDVAAALGSEDAYDILEEQGDTDYQNYTENMQKLRDAYAAAPVSVWNANLYSEWLNTLRPLLEKKGEGYPQFMQSDEWQIKNIETFAGSYAELKHDTILYSKQVMVEMGGGDDETYDDRGYVQPEPIVYGRFAFLAEQTKNGLERYGMLSDEASEDLDLLVSMANQLKTISVKELRNELPTDDEFEFIRCYGGNLEHFWFNATRVLTGDEHPTTRLYPAPIIADIATDPNGSCLEVANGLPDTIVVVVPVDGRPVIATGTVYRFYEFPWPMDERMTDTEWKQLIGAEMLDDGTYNFDGDDVPEQPQWAQRYRVEW